MKTKAPLRINFAGGGTDIEPYISDYGSYILSAAIKLYSRAEYSLEYTPKSQMEELLSQIAGKGGIRLISDVHYASGLGSSASSFVAGIKAIYPSLNKDELAHLSFYLERYVMGVRGGKQDQYCAAYGNALFMTFEGERVELKEVNIPEEITRLLIIVYTGERKHTGDEIIKDQLDRYNVKALHRQKQIAKSMRDCLEERNTLDFGKLLDETWKVKRELSPLVSNAELDDFYEKCLSLGAMAGCIMGAGEGGYMLVMENPDAEGELRHNLILQNIPYHNIEIDTGGIQIIGEGDN